MPSSDDTSNIMGYNEYYEYLRRVCTEWKVSGQYNTSFISSATVSMPLRLKYYY
jgi:hypothetical protein